VTAAQHEAAVEWLADQLDEWLFRMHGLTSSCNHHTEAEELLNALRDVLAKGGPEAEHVAAALGLTDQWAVRFERKGDPTMGNASGVITVEQGVANEGIARQAVKNGAPISATNRRVVHRVVGPWVEVPS
jgi:hypothetical protein